MMWRRDINRGDLLEKQSMILFSISVNATHKMIVYAGCTFFLKFWEVFQIRGLKCNANQNLMCYYGKLYVKVVLDDMNSVSCIIQLRSKAWLNESYMSMCFSGKLYVKVLWISLVDTKWRAYASD